MNHQWLWKYWIGFNHTQIQHGRERAIVYDRQNFSDTEKQYSITEWEALSVTVAIQKCRPYLLGNHFIVVMDHQALKWLVSAWPNWKTSPAGFDIAKIWLHYSIPPQKRLQ